MSLVVGVRFADAGKLHYYDPGDLELNLGDCVLVETARGLEFGEIVLGPREVEDTAVTRSLRKVTKRAEECDYRKLEQNVRREEQAFQVCEERIRKRNMPMKLIDVEYTFDGSKLIFYFAAEGRVDFRELVKDLAAVFRTRIELRQIGVRDEAKKIGGLGPCGRPACCNSFLEDFAPVSIKMAKEQNLSLSPTKISGLCGRLMCCLHYEHEHYRETLRKLPRVGSIVETPDGPAEVVEVDPLGSRISGRVELEDNTTEIRKYDLEVLGQRLDRAPRPEQPAVDATEERAPRQPRIDNHAQHSQSRHRGRTAKVGSLQRQNYQEDEDRKAPRTRSPRHGKGQTAGHRSHADEPPRHQDRHRRPRRPRDGRSDGTSTPQH